MKKSTYIFLLVILLASFSVLGCGSSADTSSQPQPVALSQSDSGTTITLHQNQIMTLSLQGNGSTGYTWAVVPGAESILTQQGNPDFMADSNAIGSGGTYKFTFKATAPGTATLNLIYHRPSETGVAPLQTFGLTMTIGS
jgi:inhibitor of cysteine peptidase